MIDGDALKHELSKPVGCSSWVGLALAPGRRLATRTIRTSLLVCSVRSGRTHFVTRAASRYALWRRAISAATVCQEQVLVSQKTA
jgi:hypothetical protein